jgi:hypothetical protein
LETAVAEALKLIGEVVNAVCGAVLCGADLETDATEALKLIGGVVNVVCGADNVGTVARTAGSEGAGAGAAGVCSGFWVPRAMAHANSAMDTGSSFLRKSNLGCHLRAVVRQTAEILLGCLGGGRGQGHRTSDLCARLQTR